MAIQGFGNVGCHGARFIHEHGGKVVAVSDVHGGTLNADGLDIPTLLAHAEARGSKEFAGGEPISNRQLLRPRHPHPRGDRGGITADRAAREGEDHGRGRQRPHHPGGGPILHERGITVVPDILANAGGVTVSYFEWVQNRQEFYWPAQQVNDELKRHMTEAYATLREIRATKKIALRTAAFVLAIGRVGKATVLRGI